MAAADVRLRAELLEEALAELLLWVKRQDIYDDQFAEETAWVTRLRPHVRTDGLAPLAPLYDEAFVRFEELPTELESLAQMVQRAEQLLADGRFDAALGRAGLRERLGQRQSAQTRTGRPPPLSPLSQSGPPRDAGYSSPGTGVRELEPSGRLDCSLVVPVSSWPSHEECHHPSDGDDQLREVLGRAGSHNDHEGKAGQDEQDGQGEQQSAHDREIGSSRSRTGLIGSLLACFAAVLGLPSRWVRSPSTKSDPWVVGSRCL
ncbi:hypothetical protein [Blastococcus deserti]|uniref:Uncharacterized protein n=1 Tax=Blastococcus deserti TaxID=2259033 RepID=A0ABW4XE24_9ACTN